MHDMTKKNMEVELLAAFAKDPNSLIACTGCDAVHVIGDIHHDEHALCQRCNLELIPAKTKKIDHIIPLSIASLLLMLTAINLPFLGVARAGLSKNASLIDVVFAFSQGWYLLLGIMVALFVIILPITRALALLYTVWPISLGYKPLPYAKKVFTYSESVTPWAMTEIFIIGTVVALIKIGKLASVDFGVSFWIFAALVIVFGLQNAAVCKYSIWSTLEEYDDHSA